MLDEGLISVLYFHFVLIPEYLLNAVNNKSNKIEKGKILCLFVSTS